MLKVLFDKISRSARVVIFVGLAVNWYAKILLGLEGVAILEKLVKIGVSPIFLGIRRDGNV